MKILVVGGGAMGQAFARGISTSDNGHVCAVVENDIINAQKCTSFGVTVFESIVDVVKDPLWADPDVCVVAVKPHDVAGVGVQLQGVIPTTCVAVSIAAGISIATLQESFGNLPLVRAMPNIAASELMSATAMCTSDWISEKHEQDSREVLEALGTVVRVDEELMDLVTAVSGSGPAYFFLLAEYIAAAAEKHGLDVEVAHQLITQTFLGAATMAKEVGSFATLRERVTSPGGTTAAAIDAFKAHDFEAAVFAGVQAALDRGLELDEKNSGKD